MYKIRFVQNWILGGVTPYKFFVEPVLKTSFYIIA